MIATITRFAVLFLSLTTLLLPAVGHAADLETVRLSRQAALFMALQNNIDLRTRALDSSLSETNVQGSKAIYNPQLTASFDYGRTKAAGETYGSETTSGYLGISQKLPTGATITASTRTGPTSAISDPLYDYTDWSSSVGITIYQPLLKYAGKTATELGISQNEYAHAASLADFRDKVTDTVFAVLTEYNKLYVLHQLFESRKEAVHSAQQLLEEIKTRPNPGDTPALELSNTEYALSQRQTELIEAERQVSSEEANLRYLVGIKENIHLFPVDPPSKVEPAETETEAIELAMAKRADLQALRLQLSSNELREQVSARNLLPDLALSASGGYRGYAADGGFGDTVNQIGAGKGDYWSAGLRLSFPLGNDLAKSNHRSDKLRSEQLRNRIAGLEWRIRDEIEDDNRNLLSARLQLRSTTKSRQLAEQRVAAYRQNRSRGSASVKDLLDAENDLIFARNLELNAVEKFAYQVARLWRDIGVLSERHSIRIDTDHPDQATAGEVSLATLRDLSGALPPQPLPPAEKKAPATGQRETRISYRLDAGKVIASELTRLKKQLSEAGFTPTVNDSDKLERNVFRLLLGSYADLPKARQAIDKIANLSDSGFIVRNKAGGFDAFAASFFSRERAEVEQRQLKQKGVKLVLREVGVQLPGYRVSVGPFATRAKADDAADRLRKLGIETSRSSETQ